MNGQIVSTARRTIQLADGSRVPWDDYHAPNPAAVGNNESRNGFLYNCYTHPMGRFFQETIKRFFEAGIKRIHDKELKRYDKTPFVFDDPRLKLLQSELAALNTKYLNDNDKERKRELVQNVHDIWLFMMKEDIYWRRVGLPYLVELGDFIHENRDVLLQVTDAEQMNKERWG